MIRIGTRGSQLALAQAHMTAAALRAAMPGAEIEIVEITTTGDRSALREEPMDQGKGDFVRELEMALFDKRIDVAAHSLKDLPVNLPEGLELAACLPRAYPFDVIIKGQGTETRGQGLGVREQAEGDRGQGLVNQDVEFAFLPEGARVGTSSPRRKAMLLHARPDLLIMPIRGNVPTRLRKLDEGQYDAIMLARAGLDRLGLTGQLGGGESANASSQSIFSSARIFDLGVSAFCPAPCQGIIGIETRADVAAAIRAALNDDAAWTAALCERAVVRGLGADCHTPLGVYATIANAQLSVQAVLLSPDGGKIEDVSYQGDAGSPEEIGLAVAQAIQSA